jgi:hypothetical protein
VEAGPEGPNDTTAFSSMKGNAIKASADTAKLFEAVVDYF